MFGNICLALKQTLENLWKSLESGQKSLENCHKHCYVWICYIKGKWNGCLRIKIFSPGVKKMFHLFAALTREIHVFFNSQT